MQTEMKKFSIKNQELWQKCLDANKDSELRAEINRFAAMWAHTMEEKMKGGAKLKDIVKESDDEANTENISGFMYNAAVSTLAGVWVHGEELRRWHNVDAQIHDEGEKANDSGRVLNTAILNVGVRKDNHEN